MSPPAAVWRSQVELLINQPLQIECRSRNQTGSSLQQQWVAFGNELASKIDIPKSCITKVALAVLGRSDEVAISCDRPTGNESGQQCRTTRCRRFSATRRSHCLQRNKLGVQPCLTCGKPTATLVWQSRAEAQPLRQCDAHDVATRNSLQNNGRPGSHGIHGSNSSQAIGCPALPIPGQRSPERRCTRCTRTGRKVLALRHAT